MNKNKKAKFELNVDGREGGEVYLACAKLFIDRAVAFPGITGEIRNLKNAEVCINKSIKFFESLK